MLQAYSSTVKAFPNEEMNETQVIKFVFNTVENGLGKEELVLSNNVFICLPFS